MRITCIGGGPAGLYLGILLRKARPSWEFEILERNAPGQTFGWGVVFSDETLGYLEEADPETHVEITRAFAHWDAIDTYFKGTWRRSSGHGFSGIARKDLLDILAARARALGVSLKYNTEVDDIDALRKGTDLLVAADGVNSKVRARYTDSFAPSTEVRKAKYIWLGTKRVFEAFTFLFEEYADGIFQVHAYRFNADTSTFIVETDPDTWKRAGLDTLPEAEQIALLERIFAKHLNGHALMSNRSTWIQFPTLKCGRWHHENAVLVGDSAHTAHFSIGSGTKLAMEDAIALAKSLCAVEPLEKALVHYESERRLIVEKTQAAAQDSLLFFENTKRYFHFDPDAFNFRLLTRSKKIGYENLKVRDTQFVDSITTNFAEAARATPPAGAALADVPPMFTPFRLRGLTLENRIVMSAMCMYSAVDGVPSDFHLVHLGSRAVGGAGLIVTEMTNVSALGRITLGCTGMYTDAQVAAWKRITDFVHASSKAKIALQLGHAGRKGASKLMWEGIDQPLETGAWPLMSASALPYYPNSQIPKEMTRADMEGVLGDYEAAATRALAAGFDMLEIHMAHGYLLASFISPLTNVRTDSYGGSLENRMRLPLEVFDRVRAVWPADRPIGVRISATDWDDSGITGEDSVQIAHMLKAHGCDIVDVSTGQTTPTSRPPFYGRMYQTPFADQIRNDVGIPTLAVGNITTADQANTILAAGRADLIALARTHLRDPYFTRHAAEEAGYTGLAWPQPYGAVPVQRK
jgi:anthraniloyl-CoA monooxygenase